MKKRTISKLKSIFSSKKGKRQLQEQASKSSRSPTPDSVGPASPGANVNNESFRPILRTPPPSRAGPPPSPPVPTHPVAPVAPEPSAPLPLLPCAVCGRTFVPQSLAKHVKICEKMTVKRRKTFDSFRQRREGTDLEQYLPKNFGLPENSPFLEKSPPNTAKQTPKPKPQSVRNAISKPMADLQRCPHCNRAFGVRAFERHVEWCADKAKILPAAPAQPPQHIANAKQRLNARTQYKAPLVRGRRSSQTRDKSSNSRSASVESSRDVSPPPPREYGDYKHRRTRVSESASSNDCHDDSPHMPVIRTSRNSQNNYPGDVNVKARQARLARDLSSSRKNQEPDPPSSVQQSNTDPNIKKPPLQLKSKNVLIAKKEKALKKLEQIASKYNQKALDDTNQLKNKSRDSHIPVSKKAQKPSQELKATESSTNCKTNSEISKETSKLKPIIRDQKLKSRKATSEDTLTVNKVSVSKDKKPRIKIKTEAAKAGKETSMSLDSLEEHPQNIESDRTCQSIGINTELLCVPCVIHDNHLDHQKFKKNNKLKDTKTCKSDVNNSETQIKLLYKNPTILTKSKNDKVIYDEEVVLYVKEDVSKLNFDNSVVTPSTSGNFNSDDNDSTTAFNNSAMKKRLSQNITEEPESKLDAVINIVHDEINTNVFESENACEVMHSLSEERYEEEYDHDISADISNDSIENRFAANVSNNDNQIECRYGSGETYTKFIEDPADLEEFMNITDKLVNNEEKDLSIDNFHTPKTSSIEAINNQAENLLPQPTKHAFSDTFEELKSNLKNLLKFSKDEVLVDHDISSIKLNEVTEDMSEANKKICDMEHITVYELKFYDKNEPAEDKTDKKSSELKLPSITTSKKQGQKGSNKKKTQKHHRPSHNYKMLGEQTRNNKDYKTFIVRDNCYDNSDAQSNTSDAPPLKLPRIENKRLDDNYDPFVSAARQMKELMSSDTNIPKITQNPSTKDHSRTLPSLQPTKDKTTSYLHSDNTKMLKDTLNKTYQKTPTLQRMKSFGGSNNDNSNSTFGGRCSSFRLNKNEKKPTPKLNTTFTKSSKENISTAEKNFFNRNSNLNRSFSSYSTSCYSTPKPKDKIPKIATSMYHSFQRSTIKQPVKLDKIKKEDTKKDLVNLDAILADDNSSMTDSNYIDPRLINENDNLPINVNTILNNPDIISSMESLLTTENLPAKFESFSTVNQSNNKSNNNNTESVSKKVKSECNNNVKTNTLNHTVDDFNMHYDKVMYSLEQSINSKTSIKDDDSLCEEFDLEEFMTSFDKEIHKHKSENLRTCSSTTRVIKQSDITDSNRASNLNSPSPKLINGMIPVNKSMSLNFSSNNVMSENLFPSSVKRSTSFLDSVQKKSVVKQGSGKSRHKSDQLEQDIMQSLKDFDKFYESEKNENQSHKEMVHYNGTTKRDSRTKSEKRIKKIENITNGNFTPNGKSSNDSAYSRLVSLNRLSPSKLSLVTSKESNGLTSVDQIPASSDSAASPKDDVRSISSEEFLAMERSAELDEVMLQPDVPQKNLENHINEKRANSSASRRHSESRRSRVASGSSSGSEASLHSSLQARAPPRLSRFCHECGNKFPVDTAKFCIQCGVKRLVV